MLQIHEPQGGKEIAYLINLFDLMEKGEKVRFDENNFIELIDYFITEHNHKKAFSVLTKALRFFPESYDIKLSEAQLLIESGLYVAASKKLKYLYKSNRDDLGLIMLIGINYAKLAITNKAMMFFDKALSLVNQPNKDLVLYSVAQTFMQAGRYDVASYYLTMAYQISPKDNTIILDLAFCLERNKSYKKAEKLYNIYLRRNPFSKLAWYNLGVVLSYLQRVDDAIEAFDYATAIDSEFSSPIYNKADLLYQTGKYNEAIDEFSKLLQLETSNATALYLRSLCYSNIGDVKNAVKDLKLSIKIQNDNPEAWYELARIYFSKNNLRRAKKALYYAIEEDKMNAKYWKLSAEIFKIENKNILAEKAYRNTISCDPFVDDYWFSFSDFKITQKKLDDAIEILNIGKEFIEDTVNYLLKLSSLYLLNNDKVNAKKAFNNVSTICDNALSKIRSIHPNKKEVEVLTEN